MSNAYKCDRCGKLYVSELVVDFNKVSWVRYDITKDCHPYGTFKLDLCDACKRELAEWLNKKEG